MRVIFFVLVHGLFLFSCSGSGDKEHEEQSHSKESNKVKLVKGYVFSEEKVIYGGTIDPKKTPFRGKLITSVYWEDGRGKNVILLSKRPQYFWAEENPSMGKFTDRPEQDMEATEIFAYHYVWSDSLQKWKSYWVLNDYLLGCCDVYIDWVPETLRIADWDKNNEAESVFFYTLGGGTMSIDSYYTAKLIYHVGKEKLKVEGTTGYGKKWIESSEGEEPVAEKYEGFTENFEKYKPEAEKYWKEFHRHKVYLDSIADAGY